MSTSGPRASTTSTSSGAPAADHAMRWRLAVLEKRAGSSETARQKAEKDNTALKEKVASLQQLVARREAEVDTAKGDLLAVRAQWTARSRTASERARKLSHLEETLADLMFELTQRSVDSSEGTRSTPGHTREKLLRQIRDDHVVSMDHLKSVIRMHLAFRDEFQTELKRAVAVAKAEGRSALTDKVAQLERLEAELEACKDSLHKAYVMAADSDAAREAVVDRAKDDKAGLRDRIRSLTQELELANLKVDVLEKNAASGSGRKGPTVKEIQNIRILELEDRLAKTEHESQLLLRKVRTAHETEVEALKSRLQDIFDLQTERDGLAVQVKALNRELTSYKRNYAFVNKQKMEDQVKLLSNRLQRSKEGHATTKQALAKANKRLTVLEAKAKQRSASADARKRSGAKPPPAPVIPTDPAALAELSAGNVHYAEFYRKRLKTKEEECVALNKRIKRMLVAQTQQLATISTVTAKADTQAREIFDLKKDLETARKEKAFGFGGSTTSAQSAATAAATTAATGTGGLSGGRGGGGGASKKKVRTQSAQVLRRKRRASLSYETPLTGRSGTDAANVGSGVAMKVSLQPVTDDMLEHIVEDTGDDEGEDSWDEMALRLQSRTVSTVDAGTAAVGEGQENQQDDADDRDDEIGVCRPNPDALQQAQHAAAEADATRAARATASHPSTAASSSSSVVVSSGSGVAAVRGRRRRPLSAYPATSASKVKLPTYRQQKSRRGEQRVPRPKAGLEADGGMVTLDKRRFMFADDSPAVRVAEGRMSSSVEGTSSRNAPVSTTTRRRQRPVSAVARVGHHSQSAPSLRDPQPSTATRDMNRSASAKQAAMHAMAAAAATSDALDAGARTLKTRSSQLDSTYSTQKNKPPRV